ncbi:hypothetical protein F5X68DRAFT_58528 [Plectosphaerella plurivora]|uniref:Uncharacterized protein n=1 Tax=Plectosphaerella plurivora TaxID=936078 RepID=A0A9P9AFW2_9PEZI|nr:hypothetical protein F5X68DRAFT_58528 [Plectosphaerella plurivora]
MRLEALCSVVLSPRCSSRAIYPSCCYAFLNPAKSLSNPIKEIQNPSPTRATLATPGIVKPSSIVNHASVPWQASAPNTTGRRCGTRSPRTGDPAAWPVPDERAPPWEAGPLRRPALSTCLTCCRVASRDQGWLSGQCRSRAGCCRRWADRWRERQGRSCGALLATSWRTCGRS